MQQPSVRVGPVAMKGRAARAAELRSKAQPRPLADVVLEFVWRERQVSRAEIARALGLSRSTVSEIASGLLERELVREGPEAESRGGRRPVLLEFRDDAAVILGIELGASHVTAVLTNLRGRVLQWQNRAHPVRREPERTIALTLELIESCLEAWGGDRSQLLGIGVAVASPVDPTHPDRLPEVVLPEWHGESGLERLRERYGVPVLVGNDANLGAVAEQWWGAGQGIEDFTYVKVATGVGAGYVIRGQTYPGANGVAGEIGHLSMDPEGKPCVCGNRGCLTTVVGTPALLDRARELAAREPVSVLAGRDITLEDLLGAAEAGDPVAGQVVQEAGAQLGIALAGLLNLMNPAAVIIGGGLTRLGERLLEPVREAMRTRTLMTSAAGTPLHTSRLGPQAIALGAATSVLAAALARPEMFPVPVRR